MQAFSRKIQNYIFILRTVFKISKLDFVVLLCSQILTNLLPLLILYTSKLFIEIIVDSSQRELSELIKVLLIFLGLNILRDIGAIISERGRTFISIKIQDYFNIMIMEKTARLSLEVFDTAEYYQQYTDAQRILGGRWDSLVFAPFVLISLLLNALGVSAILIDYNPWLFLCVLVGVLPKVVADIKSRKERHRFHSDEVPEVRKYNYIKGIVTNKDALKEIKVYSLVEYLINQYKLLHAAHVSRFKEILSTSFKRKGFSTIFYTAFIVGVEAYLVIQVFLRRLTLANYQFYFGSIGTVRSVATNILSIYDSTLEGELLLDVYNKFMDLDESSIPDGELQPVQFDSIKIQLINVSFKYPSSDKYVLRRINLEINQGDKLAIAGLNGAGKTTLIRLIMGLYMPTSGRILVNGTEIEKLDIEAYHRKIGVVFQDFFRYAFTLRENINLSDIANRDDESAIHEAAKKADLLDVVRRLEQGYDTYLTKRFSLDGISDLSLGQWQKVAIARAFFRGGSLLIFDEPASALDPLAEYEIMKHFQLLSEGKTAIFITHRLSGIRNMDRIIVLKNGVIIEEGNHQELMAKSGEYAFLYTTQSEGYSETGS